MKRVLIITLKAIWRRQIQDNNIIILFLHLELYSIAAARNAIWSETTVLEFSFGIIVSCVTNWQCVKFATHDLNLFF